MPRPVEQDVHTAFQEFRGEGDKCISVQCLYCREVRAKNTTRQRAHLLKCSPYLQQHPDAFAATFAAATANEPDGDGSPSDSFGEASNLDATGNHTTLGFTPNPRINAIPQVHSRPSFSGVEDSPAPKRQKTSSTKNTNPSSSLPEIPLREVHAAFEEFKAKEDDKGLSVRCLYCNQVRAKNTSRQREHLLICPEYQHILKEKIPANHLLHQFDEDDIARSLALPTPVLDLDFRLSIRVKPKVNTGQSNFGQLSWVSCVGGSWAGRWGKGSVLPGGQDTQTTVNETSTNISARYLMQTNDEDPAFFVCIIKGWLIADKEIMDRLQNPIAADNVTASRYRFRVTMSMETGDERYLELNGGVWVGAGCRRGAEIVYDFYRVN